MERQKDLRLLETAPPEGQARQLVPKAIDADDEDPESSEGSSDDDDDDVRPNPVSSGGHLSVDALLRDIGLDACT